MDGSTLFYLNIQFTRSHTGEVLIASLILQRWQSQVCSWLRRNFFMCMSLKMGYVATLSHGNRQPLQCTPSMIPLVLLFIPLWKDTGVKEMISKDSSNHSYCGCSPALHWTLQWRLTWIKGLPPQKAHQVTDVPSGVGEARTAQTLCCWGWEILEQFFSWRRLRESIALLSGRAVIRGISGDSTAWDFAKH